MDTPGNSMKSKLSEGLGKTDVNPALLKYTLVLVGLCCANRLMRDFAGELVPLILAGMFVSCIEPAVQSFESVFVRMWRLLLHCVRDESHCCVCCCRRPKPASAATTEPPLEEPLLNPAREGDDDDVPTLQIGGDAVDDKPLEAEDSNSVLWVLYPLPDRVRKKLPRSVSRAWDSEEETGKCMCARILAVMLTLMLTVGFVVLVVAGLVDFQKTVDYDVYANGFEDLVSFVRPLLDQLLNNPLVKRVPEDIRKEAEKQVAQWQSRLGAYAMDFVQEVIEKFRDVLAGGFFFLLYSFMWLIKPVSSKKAGLFWLGTFFTTVRTYFMLKSVINLVYCVCVFILLVALGMELAPVITLLTFFVLFIPQIGDFVPGCLPGPILMIDSRTGVPHRCWMAALATLGMLLIKFSISSFLEPMVMAKGPLVQRGLGKHVDAEEVHPVLIIFVVVVFGNLWGAIGMLISVPMLWLTFLVPRIREGLRDTG